MKRYVNSATIAVVVGLSVGILAAATVIDTDPAFLGWLFGIGMGLMGGAFIAAITSGNALISGPSASRGRRGQSAAPWLDPQDNSTDSKDS